MQKLFTKILVPVAFGRNTRWSVEKAIQLANKFDCDIHLLHVQTPPASLPSLYKRAFKKGFTNYSQDALREKMKSLVQEYSPNLREGLIMSSAVTVGYWQSVVKDMIIAEHIDLAVIPRSHRQFSSIVLRRINVNKLSQQTNCPVMTITRNFSVQQLENVVVPIHDLLPVKKLLVAYYLSLQTGCRIYLMGTNNPELLKTEEGYLMKAYQLLSGFGKPNIHCALRDNIDAAAGTLSYAKDVRANLIVVNPGQESRLRGWWNRLRGKYLCRESDIPVMTVAV